MQGTSQNPERIKDEIGTRADGKLSGEAGWHEVGLVGHVLN